MLSRFIEILREETSALKNLRILSMAFRRLWSKGSKTGIVLAVIFSILEAILYTVNPSILRHLTDVLFLGSRLGFGESLTHSIPFLPSMTIWQATLWLMSLMILVSILWFGAFNISTGFARNSAYRSQVTFGSEVFEHLLRLDLDYHNYTAKGQVIADMDRAIQRSQDFLYNAFFMQFLRAGLSIIFILYAIYALDWRVFLICLVALSFGMYTNFMFGSSVSKEEKKSWNNVSKVQARSKDVLSNIVAVKLYGNEKYEAHRRQEEAEKQLPHLYRVAFLWRKLTTFENIIQNAGFALAFWIILKWMMPANRFTTGQVVQFITLYLMLYTFFMSLLFKYLDAQALVPQLQAVKQVLERKPTVVNRIDPLPYSGLRHQYRFKDVSFIYPATKRQVIQDIDLVIPKGKITMFVGESGCGKSTLVRLLTRLYIPSSGSILCDGLDIQDFDYHAYRRSFSVVSQEAYLFNETVAYNIGYSRLGSSMDKIVEAAKIAQIHNFVSSLERGYETMISENAANISGGEKQRIALARSILAADADTIILDEPTTGLDKKTAQNFLDAAIRSLAGKTIIAVTHDEGVMSRADQIVYIEDGRIVQGVTAS